MKLILASASERRQELLKRLTPDFEIAVSDFDEKGIEYNGSSSDYVLEISKGKALKCLEKVNNKEESIIIACDTIVCFNENLLGKPKDEMDAFLMLSMLSGGEHEVYSGITLLNTASNRMISDYECTKVRFSEISSEDINKYISTKEPMDKAGAYGIQGYGGVFVERIEGCFYNVVGLPLNKLKKMFRDMGVNL